jgi:hypothetical protein
VFEDAVDDFDGGIVRLATPIMKDVAAVNDHDQDCGMDG